MTVAPAGGVLLVAPERLPTDTLDGIGARKAERIVRGVQPGGPPRSPREFVSGESVLYLGHYRLKVHPHAAGEAKPHGDAKPRGNAKSGAGRSGGGRPHGDAKRPGDWPYRGTELRGRLLHVPAPACAGQAVHARAALAAWLRRHAAARLPERVEAWRAKTGVAMPRVVADQRKRWGSCNRSGTIRLNRRIIIQAPCA